MKIKIGWVVIIMLCTSVNFNKIILTLPRYIILLVAFFDYPTAERKAGGTADVMYTKKLYVYERRDLLH